MNPVFHVLAACLVFVALHPTEVLAKNEDKGVKDVDCSKEKDDQAKLQKELDKAKPGRTIRVTGTCTDIALVIDSPGVTLAGTGPESTFLQGNGSAPVIEVRDVGGVRIEGLHLAGGTAGLDVSNARVSAADVVSEGNSNGLVVSASGALTCEGCAANDNADWGFLIFSGLSLCGDISAGGNGRDGLHATLGGKIFASAPVCGGPVNLALNGNEGSGLALFQNGSAQFIEASMTAEGNALYGMSAIDSSAAYFDRSAITLLSNTSFLNVLSFSGSVVRIAEAASITTDALAFSGDYSTFYSGGSYPPSLIFCNAKGGGETSPGCP